MAREEGLKRTVGRLCRDRHREGVVCVFGVGAGVNVNVIAVWAHLIKVLERLSKSNLVLYGRVETQALRKKPPGWRMDYHIGAGVAGASDGQFTLPVMHLDSNWP